MNLLHKNLKLIIFLAVIFFTLVVIKFLLVKKQNVPLPPPPPTGYPTQIITPTPQILPPVVTSEPKVKEFYKKLEEDTYKGFPLFDYIPYKTDNWKITYIKSLHLVVTLKKNTPEIRQEVLDWIKTKGVDPNTHKITWETP